jgi:hypothetical protein
VSERRYRLFEKLQLWASELRSIGRASDLIVNGSFVTGKAEPNDIDVVLVTPAEHDWPVELRPSEYLALSKSRVRRRFGFDVLLARENSPEHAHYLAFFQGTRGSRDRKKGILRVTL